jgi:hypothetical protein
MGFAVDNSELNSEDIPFVQSEEVVEEAQEVKQEVQEKQKKKRRSKVG